LYIADGYSPEVGFVSRDDLRRTSASGRFSPRPASVPHVDQFSLTGSATYTMTTANVLETREAYAEFLTTFENTQSVSLRVDNTHDVIDRPFPIVPTVTIPVGAYTFNTVRAQYQLAQSQRVSGTFAVERGGFYDGDDTALSYNGRIVLSPQLALDPSVSFRWTDLPAGSFTTQQYRTRITYTFTPLMFFSGLMQYNTNSHVLSCDGNTHREANCSWRSRRKSSRARERRWRFATVR
jgi:hypothetical protein